MTDDDKLRWRTAIGKNADRYLKRFERIAAGSGRWRPGWNWAAFLHSTAWFCYRRMYRWAFLNLIGPWAVPIGLLVVAGKVAPGANLDGLALSLLLAYAAIAFLLAPMFADTIYYRHLAARLPAAKPPSAWTQVAADALILAWIVPFAVAILVPSYGDYTARAKMSEAVLAASAMRASVTEFYVQEHRFPSAQEAAQGAGAPISRYVQSIEWDAGQRAVVVTLREVFPGKRFMLRAVEEGGQLVNWKCATIDFDKKHLPASCRD